MRTLFSSWLDILLLFIPLTVGLELLKADPLFIFVSAAFAIIPLAGLLGRATEHLTVHVGAGIGGLLNASVGNAAELIIALAALRAGLHDVVRASLGNDGVASRTMWVMLWSRRAAGSDGVTVKTTWFTLVM